MIERFAGAGVPADNVSFVRDTYTFNFPDSPAESRGRVPELLRPDDERVRGGGEETAAPPICSKELEALFEQPEHEPRDGRHLDPGDLPARDGDCELVMPGPF